MDVICVYIYIYTHIYLLRFAEVCCSKDVITCHHFQAVQVLRTATKRPSWPSPVSTWQWSIGSTHPGCNRHQDDMDFATDTGWGGRSKVYRIVQNNHWKTKVGRIFVGGGGRWGRDFCWYSTSGVLSILRSFLSGDHGQLPKLYMMSWFHGYPHG